MAEDKITAADINAHALSAEEAAEIVVHVLQQQANWGAEKKVADAIVEAMQRQHRTLQAGIIRTLRDTLKNYANLDDYQVDPRNEYAREYARRVAEIEEDGIPLI